MIPRVVSVVSKAVAKREAVSDTLKKLTKSLRKGLMPNGFPAFIFKLTAGVYLGEPIFRLVLSSVLRGRLSKRLISLVSIYAASLVSAVINFRQYKWHLKSHPRGDDTSDLTFFLVVRFLDILFRNASKGRLSRSALGAYDVAMFSASSFAIMFAWFYYPKRLPNSYRNWITRAASMDSEILHTLKYIRDGEIIYGQAGPHDHLLRKMCVKYNLHPDLGKFSKTAPIPCLLVHQNRFENCELHALWRFYRGFVFAMSIYLPVNVVLQLLNHASSKTGMVRAVKNSSRSSAFLATFILLNWYSVCLVRTRIGPLLFPNATPQQLDDTYGPGLASITCGLSSLIEFPKRRGELALFVAPRALSVITSRGSGSIFAKLEVALFATTFAAIVTGVRNDPQSIRGFFQRLLKAVY